MLVARRVRSPGFTLIELMMVVTILGILAVVAVPRYISYVYKSKTTEAVGFLAEIKARQEAYRSDFGQYCNVSTTQTTWFPGSSPNNVPQTWNLANGTGPNWQQLGAIPPGNKSLFSYSTVAGNPGTLPNGAAGFSDARGYTGADFWFISSALGDLNNDRATVTFESYSASPQLYVSNAAGWQ